MLLKKLLPTPDLQPFVRCYWLFDIEETDTPFSQLLFPFGSFELILNLHNPPQMQILGNNKSFTQPDCFYPGQFTKPFILDFAKSSKCIGVSFHSWVGNLLFDIPAKEFTDKTISLSSIHNENNLLDKLLHSKNESDLIIQLETYLIEKIKNYKTDTVSSLIAKTIIGNPSLPNIENILHSLGISRRRIEQRFISSIGLPMGCFARKIRFQNAVSLIQTDPLKSLSYIGLEAGYYDQSHFIREFKKFSGLSPNVFKKETSSMKNFVSNLIQHDVHNQPNH